MPSMAGTSSRPASVGDAPVVVCRNSGTKTLTANSAAVARNSAARRDGHGARAQQPQRDDRIGGPPLAHRQRDAERQGAGGQRAGSRATPRRSGRRPRCSRASAQLVAAAEQPCAGNIERPGRRRRLGGRQPQAQAGQRRDPQRQVHVEHPAPGRVVDQQPAGERAGDRRRPRTSRRCSPGSGRARAATPGRRLLPWRGSSARPRRLPAPRGRRPAWRCPSPARRQRTPRGTSPATARACGLRPRRSPSLPHSGVVAAAATT